MRSTITAGLAALLLLGATIAPASAAPAAQACQPGAFRQHDMAGTFASAEHQMRVEIFACGGSYLQWDNQYGTHYVTYYSDTRLDGGGVAATLMPQFTVGLDGLKRVGYKPAEPGFIQVITVDPYSGNMATYRLRKIANASAF